MAFADWFLRHLTVTMLAAALAPAGAAVASSDASARAPIAFVAESARDLGIVGLGERATAEFRVENRGGAPLRIDLVSERAVRGVEVRVSGAPAAPGGAAAVAVEVDTGALVGPGPFEIAVSTNDPERERLTFLVSLEVRRFLLARPGYARYVTVQKEREGTIAQTIWSADERRFRVLAVESPYPHLSVAFREARAAERDAGITGSQWRVESTLASNAPVGALSGNIVVTTDHSRQKRIPIPVSGFVRPIFAVTPPAARLGDLEAEKDLRFGLHVKNFATEEIMLRSAEADVEGVSVEIVPVTPGRVYHLRLGISRRRPAGPFSGTIRVATSSPKVPVIEVPLSGRVLRSSGSAGAD